MTHKRAAPPAPLNQKSQLKMPTHHQKPALSPPKKQINIIQLVQNIPIKNINIFLVQTIIRVCVT